MPFKVTPAVMIEQLAMDISDHITWFPVKGGVSKHYSPYMILSMKVINYRKCLMNSFDIRVRDLESHLAAPKFQMDSPRPTFCGPLVPTATWLASNFLFRRQTKLICRNLQVNLFTKYPKAEVLFHYSLSLHSTLV